MAFTTKNLILIALLHLLLTGKGEEALDDVTDVTEEDVPLEHAHGSGIWLVKVLAPMVLVLICFFVCLCYYIRGAGGGNHTGPAYSPLGQSAQDDLELANMDDSWDIAESDNEDNS